MWKINRIKFPRFTELCEKFPKLIGNVTENYFGIKTGKASYKCLYKRVGRVIKIFLY